MKENNEAVIVRIGLFSGRPNPEMKLTGDTASQYAELVKSTVGKEPIHPLPPSKLGEFYGFLVQAPEQEAKRLGLPPRTRVLRGVLTEMTREKHVHWRDVGGIERFLVRLAYAQGHGDLLRKVGVEEPE